MNAPLWIVCAWLGFAGTHLLLGLPPLRDRLAGKLGEMRFVAIFSAVAGVSLGTLALAVAIFGGAGPAGPALGRHPSARTLFAALAFFGLSLAITGLMNYMRSPMALFRTHLHPAAGIERVTRHAFFMGLTLFASAHALLASTIASSLHFLGFAALATIGALLQDRKLLARHGTAYADYIQATSVLPFVALLQRRQSLAMDRQLLRRCALSAAIAALLLAAHPLWSAFNGATLAGLMAIGGVLVSARRWRHAKTAEPSAAPRSGEGLTESHWQK